MNVFDLDADLINRYEQFARSFTTIRADDLRQQIDAVYDSQKFWPEPLIAALAQWGAPPPSSETIAGVAYPLCWPGHMVMAVAGNPPTALVERCAELGRDLIELPEMPGASMPSTLAAALGVS